MSENEKATRKDRIDRQLECLGWTIVKWQSGLDNSCLSNHAVEDYKVDTGNADYALFVGGKLLGFIEAKKHGIGCQNVLEQAKRYLRGAERVNGDWGEYKVPFLYSSSGEQVYFLDVRNKKNISRTIGDFHTPEALHELYSRDVDEVYRNLIRNEDYNVKLRPYQKDAIQAIEENIADCKRKMMVAMATGTGKTFMTVSLIYRLLSTKAAKRILFLVDRKSLAAQASVAFSSTIRAKDLSLIRNMKCSARDSSRPILKRANVLMLKYYLMNI